jgi:hypothetical protein
VIQGSLNLMVRERSVGNDAAILTNQVHRGIGKK